MDITELGELLDWLEIVTRRKKIILELFPDKILTQSQLAEKTGIAPPNLSKYVSVMLEKDIIEVNQENREKHFVKLVQLKPRTKEMFRKAKNILVIPEKPPLEDIENFKKIMEKLLNPSVQDYAKNSIQIMSQRYVIPLSTGFFEFLKNNLNHEQISTVLLTLLKSARNIVRELSLEDRVNVLTLLGNELYVLTEEGDSALKQETINLLEELGAYNMPYQALKDKYLEQRNKKDSSDIFRSLLLKDHKDKLMDLWISMMNLYESATETEKRWLDQEFALLR